MSAPRLFFLLFAASILLASCGTARKTGRKADRVKGAPDRETGKRDPAAPDRVDELLDFAKEYIGIRYRYGGNTPREGFDCSGFACYVFNEFGVRLPRVSADMSRQGRYVGRNELQKGDLVFFATGSTRRINHVGIVVQTLPEVLMIHSSTSKGIRIDDINSEYYRKRYVTSRRVDLDQ